MLADRESRKLLDVIADPGFAVRQMDVVSFDQRRDPTGASFFPAFGLDQNQARDIGLQGIDDRVRAIDRSTIQAVFVRATLKLSKPPYLTPPGTTRTKSCRVAIREDANRVKPLRSASPHQP